MTDMLRVSRLQRQDNPFDPEMTEADVDRLLDIPPFSRMEPGRFPASASLRDILQFSTGLRSYKDGDLVVRKGDYGNSSFFIISGTVRVVIDDIPESLLGRREAKGGGFLRALLRWWCRPREPEVRPPSSYIAQLELGSNHGLTTSKNVSFLQDVPRILQGRTSVLIDTGEFFGEIASLGRTPRTATVLSEGECELLEIQWQGLRDLRKYAPEFKQHIDTLYRERVLETHLREIDIFRDLDQNQIAEVADVTDFASYGTFDWYGDYKRLIEDGTSGSIEHESVIAEEGTYINDIILVRSGFARVSRRYGKGHQTVGYLGSGRTFGLQEVCHNWKHGDQLPLQTTLSALGHVDVLTVPTQVIEKFVLGNSPPEPLVSHSLLPPSLTIASEGQVRTGQSEVVKRIGVDELQLLVEHHFINGTSTMLIDLSRCTRCDDCVRACADSHDNNPRFIRHGQQLGDYMVANACMHCADPVCMIGCPTGAIHRDQEGGQIVINDSTCIGCTTCANSCPYDNIRMVQIRDEGGQAILDKDTNAPILKATKCDLCIDQPGGPSCQRACPHDALVRVDLHEGASAVADWMSRK